ncbi:helix-turn-helix domain-containing protein [Streptomyces albidoflavus]|uniref:helix-turn-helix domain-containing protein n=1 Tax=Streptomyces albidoflavus TaxID=1886 RepID=UPI0034088857
MALLYVPPGHLTTDQAAAVLGITPSGIRQAVRRGRLTRAGGTARYPYFTAADIASLSRHRPTPQRTLTRRSTTCHDRGGQLCPTAD